MLNNVTLGKKLFLVFSFIVIFFFFYSNFRNASFSTQKAQAAIAPISQNVTIPPSVSINPTTAKPTLDAILSGAPAAQFFSNFPADYPNYYSYAKKLFDGVDFLVSGNIPIPGLTLTIVGPNGCTPSCNVLNGQNITYTITALYSGTAALVVGDTFPDTTTLVSKSGTATMQGANTIIWDLSKNTFTTDNSDPSTPKKKWIFVVTLSPKQNNINVHNLAFAEVPTAGGNASAVIKPFNSAARSSYNNDYPEWQVWSYSSCSGCAIASVIAAYGVTTFGGQPMNCGTVLEYEKSTGAYTVGGGLQGWNTISNTASHFGFKSIVGQGDKTLDDIIKIANNGNPVVVGVITHVMVIKGGDSQNISLVDSSLHQWTTMNRNVFLTNTGDGVSHWDGTYAILTPK